MVLWLIWPVISVRISKHYVKAYPSLRNPIYQALFEGVPLKQFSAIVASNSSWVNQIEHRDGSVEDESILSMCADLGLTNHVRILIRNGADTNEALAYLFKYEETNAVALIRYCQHLH